MYYSKMLLHLCLSVEPKVELSTVIYFIIHLFDHQCLMHCRLKIVSCNDCAFSPEPYIIMMLIKNPLINDNL